MLRTPSAFVRLCVCGMIVVAGSSALIGCGGTESAPVNTPGVAPVDNDEASRQKAMEDFMKNEAASKKK